MSQLLEPFLANIIRREEKRVIKRFNLYFAMSTDASLDLGASPARVSPVQASESTNVMGPLLARVTLPFNSSTVTPILSDHSVDPAGLFDTVHGPRTRRFAAGSVK
jgi:hypothetical protein